MVLSPGVLISLHVVVQYTAITVHADMVHGNGREQGLTTTVLAHLIYSGEGTTREGQFAHRGIAGTAYEQRILAKPCSRIFVEGVRSYSSCLSALCRHHEDIHGTLSVAGKGQLRTVGAPQRGAVVTLVRGKLLCLTTHRRHRVDISHVGKSNARSIRRDSTATHPQRFFRLCKTRQAYTKACDKG